MSHTRFGEENIILSKEFVNILSEDLFKVSSGLFHSKMVQGEHKYLKVSVLQ